MTYQTKVEKRIDEVREKLEEEGENRVPLDNIEHYQDTRRQCEVFRCIVRIDGEKYGFEQAMTLEAIEDSNADDLYAEMTERNMKQLEEAVSLEYTKALYSRDIVDGIICRVSGHVRCLKCDEKILEFDEKAFNEADTESRCTAKKFMVGKMFEHGSGLHFL